MRLQAVKDAATDQNFRQVEGQFPIPAEALAESAKELFPQLTETAERKIAFGSTTVEFSASRFSKEKAISHGLGVTPIAVIASAEFGEIVASTRSYTSTQFSLTAGNWLEALTTTRTIHWIAIG
jgi:hypothetical protein